MANIKRCAARILNWVSQIAAIFHEPHTKIRFKILEVYISEKRLFLFIKQKTCLSVICFNVLEFYLNLKGFNMVMAQH